MRRVVIRARLLLRARRGARQLTEKVVETAASVLPLLIKQWRVGLTERNELHAIRISERGQIGAFDRKEHLLSSVNSQR
jgi:hypothetical protein